MKNTVSSAMATAGKVVDTVKSSFSDSGKAIQSTAVTVGQAVTSAVSQVTEAVTKAKAVAAENVEKIHTGLDVAGFVPVYGEVADAANALIYLAQGDISNAAISGAAFVPVIGSAGTGTRLAAKGIGAVADASAAAKGMKAAGIVTDGVKAAEQVKDAEKAVGGVVKGAGKAINDILPSGITREGLTKVAGAPGKGGVTPIGRAFQKHAGNAQRAGTFTGEVTGNVAKNTEQGINYLNQVLDNPNSTAAVRNTKAYGDVLDVRMPDGTGVRYSADGKSFIGFLEKYTPTK
ncbi:hypothetical protein [Clostridium merdae]|uniref:hypothetical protein n=1 Tax=Clostridium merdae TaxID=1958780 RepID=UPI000A26E1FD|nr:hypothetical protein [Clostridium merdae]